MRNSRGRIQQFYIYLMGLKLVLTEMLNSLVCRCCWQWVERMTHPPSGPSPTAHRFRAKREQLEILEGISPESRGQDLALTVLYVPSSLDSGTGVPFS